jgi:hypothetical protein
MAIGQDDNVRDQSDAFGHCGTESKGHERIESIMPARLQPPVGRCRMVGETDAVEPSVLSGLAERLQRIPGKKIRMRRMREKGIRDGELHGRTLPRPKIAASARRVVISGSPL